jgi:hypothetical protein
METQNLETASNYINNLLLARGLLKNGKPIDFAQPDNDGGSDATMAQIINLVNDLVVRRDVSLMANQYENMLTKKNSARPNIAKTWPAPYAICGLRNRNKWTISYESLRLFAFNTLTFV